MILHYLKINFRNIRNEKFRYIITTLGIAVGMVVFAIVSFVANGYNRTWHKIPVDDKLYTFESKIVFDNNIYPSEYVFNRYIAKIVDDSIPGIDKIAVITGYGFHFSYLNDPTNPNFRHKGSYAYVTKDFFQLYGIEFIEGGVDHLTDIKGHIVLSETYAKKLFGNKNGVGTQITDSRGVSYIVAGVVKPLYDIYYAADFYEVMDSHVLSFLGAENISLVRLNEDSDLKQINQRLEELTTDHYDDDQYKYVTLIPFEGLSKEISPMLYTGLLSVGILILLVALLNFASLLIGSMQTRVRQFTLRKIVGAKPWTFFLMLIIEIILILIVSTAFAYLILELLINLYQNTVMVPDKFRSAMDNNLDLLLQTPFKIALYIFAASILFALIMSFKIQKLILVQGIRGHIHTMNKNYTRTILIFTELFLTFIFINISLYLIHTTYKSIPKVYESMPKEKANSILTLPIYQLDLYKSKDEILKRIQSIPGVLQANNEFLRNGFPMMEFSMKSDEDSHYTIFRVNSFTQFENYHQFMETDNPLLKKALKPNEAIVNKQIANLIKERNLSSFKVRDNVYTGYDTEKIENTIEIVGVLDEFPYTSNSGSDDYNILLSKDNEIMSFHNQYMHNPISIKCETKQTKTVEKAIRELLKEYMPENVEYKLDSLHDLANIEKNNLINLFISLSIASLLSMIISILGVYAAISNDTKKKRKEIAIRKINGASKREILLSFLRQYALILFTAAIISGVSYRYLLKTMLVNNYQGITVGIDVLVWVLLSIITFATIYFQIKKAANENPADVIK